ncbi:hypothetical protein GGE56_007762 [Rhizobium leguminosarum]|nr:hypothetical protein [Rhizobium leguminosarum]MBB6299398.1 hypothetical protein [Rhizobium leguminosarum]
MERFKSARHLQRFVSVHDPIANLFNVPRHGIPSTHHRELRATAMQAWRQIAPRRMNQSLTPRSCLRSVKFTVPAEPFGQVTLTTAGTGHPQQRVQEQPVVRARAAFALRAARHTILDPFPLVIPKRIHNPRPYPKVSLESDLRLRRNPKPLNRHHDLGLCTHNFGFPHSPGRMPQHTAAYDNPNGALRPAIGQVADPCRKARPSAVSYTTPVDMIKTWEQGHYAMHALAGLLLEDGETGCAPGCRTSRTIGNSSAV